MLRVLKERSGQCKKRIRTGSQIKLLLAKDFLACFLILSLDVSSCLFFFFFSFDWIILHSFQGGKPAAGTNFPDYLIFPLCPKQLPFPMFPHEKQPCQLLLGLLLCTPGCLLRLPLVQAGCMLTWGSGDLWSTPSSLSFNFPFLRSGKTLLDPTDFYFFKKEQVQSWSSRALCLGAVIFRGPCLILNYFSS